MHASSTMHARSKDMLCSNKLQVHHRQHALRLSCHARTMCMCVWGCHARTLPPAVPRCVPELGWTEGIPQGEGELLRCLLGMFEGVEHLQDILPLLISCRTPVRQHRPAAQRGGGACMVGHVWRGMYGGEASCMQGEHGAAWPCLAPPWPCLAPVCRSGWPAGGARGDQRAGRRTKPCRCIVVGLSGWISPMHRGGAEWMDQPDCRTRRYPGAHREASHRAYGLVWPC